MPAFLLDDLAPTVSLDGDWEFQLAGQPPQRLPVPSAWEAHLADKRTDGPAVYRRRVSIPESGPSSAVMLEVGAISYDATVHVNGQLAGTHRGMWSPFQLDITPLTQLGDNLLEIEVWKPGGRFPARESLAGFLPDVATSFGGLWQSVCLRALGRSAFTDLKLMAYGGGWLDVQGRVVRLRERRQVEVLIELVDSAGVTLGRARPPLADDSTFAAHLEVGSVSRWRPDSPTLYTVHLSQIVRGVELVRVSRRVGFRNLRAEGETVLMNDAPAHVRGVLDWGWEPEIIRPAPTREAVLEKFNKARALGFNMVKLCLHVPDEATFDAADEAGMLLWLEMPLWLPRLTPQARELALREFADVFRRLHHHPSVAVVSLGCELNAEADEDFLRSLNLTARAWFPNSLHCDNSGSAEAYGGATTGLADFYDYHFYSEPHFFRPLVNHFDRPYRRRRPWIFGEFSDADTLRDYGRLDTRAWWLTDDLALDRDDFLATRDYHARLKAAGVGDGGAALAEVGRRQATAVRKFVLEQTRLRFPSGGYVVTGWRDTPITTSGVVDDGLEFKFKPDDWQKFNADRVLLLDRAHHRRWLHGGDRPLHNDPFTWRQGETAQVHLLLSNGTGPMENARLRWMLTGPQDEALAQGGAAVGAVDGAVVRELAAATFDVPTSEAGRPIELRLAAELAAEATGQVVARNEWKLWGVPATGNLYPPEAAGGARLFSSTLNVDVQAFTEGGASAVIALPRPSPSLTQPVPFWREAIHVFEPHELWERLPHAGYADMRFFGVATDFALDLAAVEKLLGPQAQVRPVWRRFDARKMTWLDYVLDVRYGAGRLLITTLRLDGGLGCQPQGLEANPMGAWVLASLFDVLKKLGN